MSDIYNLKKRLASIQSIEKTSKALQVITSAKIKTTQDLLKSFKEYKQELTETLSLIPPVSKVNFHPSADKIKTSIIVVITSNRGFCGGFNHAVIEKTNTLIQQLKEQGKKIQLYLIGKKGIQYYKDKGFNVIGLDIKLAEKPDAKSTLRLVAFFLSRITNKKISDVYLAYNEFKTILSQKPVYEKILPFNPASLQKTSSASTLVFEPNLERVSQETLLHYISVYFLAKLVGSTVGELGARLLVTKNAVDNCSDLKKQLTLQINKARQAQITGELSGLLSNFEILKEAEE